MMNAAIEDVHAARSSGCTADAGRLVLVSNRLEIAVATWPRHAADQGVAPLLIPLPAEESHGDDLGYGRTVLRPLFHGRHDLVRYSDADFAAYRRGNERFAKVLSAELRPGDRIWVQDHHLIPLAWELRRLGCTQPIGLLLRIPFPSAELFAGTPDHAWLTEALLHYDAIGLQCRSSLKNFLGYVRGLPTAIVTPGLIEVDGKSVVIELVPIGADGDVLATLALLDPLDGVSRAGLLMHTSEGMLPSLAQAHRATADESCR